jgi:hypothetical protein
MGIGMPIRTVGGHLPIIPGKNSAPLRGQNA